MLVFSVSVMPPRKRRGSQSTDGRNDSDETSSSSFVLTKRLRKSCVAADTDDAAVDDDDDEGDDSRMSSVTDDVAVESALTSDIGTSEVPKVPVLKLKVAPGSFVDGSAIDITIPSNECSSDVDAASENLSTTRLSSCSEVDDQTSSEVR
jgi:hypothetical protein